MTFEELKKQNNKIDMFLDTFEIENMPTHESSFKSDLQLNSPSSTNDSDAIDSSHADTFLIEKPIGMSVQMDILKSKVRMLRTQLSQVHKSKNDSDHAVKVLDMKLQDVLADNKRLERRFVQMSTKSDSHLSLKEKCDKLEKDNYCLRKEVEESLQKAQSNHSTREDKLSHALKQVERLKTSIADGQNCKSETDTVVKKERDDMLATISNLEKEKRELLTVVTTQMKLLDIIKRQKVHLEASRMLSFTEDEFFKILEWDPK